MVLEHISNYMYFIFLEDFLLVKRSDSYNRAMRLRKPKKKKKKKKAEIGRGGRSSVMVLAILFCKYSQTIKL